MVIFPCLKTTNSLQHLSTQKATYSCFQHLLRTMKTQMKQLLESLTKSSKLKWKKPLYKHSLFSPAWLSLFNQNTLFYGFPLCLFFVITWSPGDDNFSTVRIITVQNTNNRTGGSYKYKVAFVINSTNFCTSCTSFRSFPFFSTPWTFLVFLKVKI